VLHNFRPGKAEKLGIGYEQLAAVKPDLVYVYLPGFGSTGPKSGFKSFAPLLSGFTGPLYEAAGAGRPPVRRTIGNEDYYNGFVGAVAVLMALEHRSRTGQGQRVENPQLHSSLLLQTHQMLDADDANVSDLQLDADQLGWGPLYRLYETSDGWICLACVGDAAFDRLTASLGLAALTSTDPDDVIAAGIDARLRELTSAAAFALLDGARVPCEIAAAAPIQSDYLWEDWALQSGRVYEQQTVPYGYVREIGLTVRLLGTPGEHSRELLTEIGWDDARIEALLAGPCRQYIAGGA
jgi:crotonobetainyl-CoA:carnitine CoA-transferase CaiB-like acyl-CoA transferase